MGFIRILMTPSLMFISEQEAKITSRIAVLKVRCRPNNFTRTDNYKKQYFCLKSSQNAAGTYEVSLYRMTHMTVTFVLS